ncbi:peptidoglycan-binding protein [Streptomyces sp. NPDC052012]|uniref:peptidoglycan-binding domain-containing protein n=1 Tax=Streptomyces sp. NPDC052012 TaxID=3155051 RepID=UPI00344DD8A2
MPEGNPCPECGTPRNSDNTPSCTCTARAADALRDARTAEAAAAEDFDPLRIRPYVELDGSPAPDTPDGAQRDDTPADATMPLRAVPPETSVLPTPLAPPTSRPNADDLDLFEATPPSGEARPAADDDTLTTPPRRLRRTALLGAAGAVVAVIGAAGWASGLFSYETPSRDKALPDEVRASVPDVTPTEPSPAPSTSAPSASPSTSPSASASPSTSASASPSPSASSATPTPSKTTEPAGPTTSAPAESAEDADDGERTAPAPVLRRGDRGDEVTELQLRLRQLYLYNDDINGYFNRRVEDALKNYQWSRGIREELGVYGPQTRAMLESETREP